MKYIFTFFTLFLLSASSLMAQHDTAATSTNWVATPNPNMQDWKMTSSIFGNYYDPIGWDDPNSQTSYTGIYTVTEATGANAFTGSYSAELTTQNISVASIVAPGVITTGTLPTSTSGSITGGIAYTLRPDSIVIWFKYTPQGSDYAFVGFYLFGTSNSDTIAKATYQTAPGASVTKYTRFAAPLKYLSSGAVTNSMWVVTSSGAASPVAGSVMYVGNMSVILNSTVGISQPVSSNTEVTLNPNPASNYVQVNNNYTSNVILSVYDMTGRKIDEQRMASGSTNMNISGYPNGVYIYNVTDENQTLVKTGKLVVQK